MHMLKENQHLENSARWDMNTTNHKPLEEVQIPQTLREPSPFLYCSFSFDMLS